MTKSLKKQIQKKLDKLSHILDNITEAQIIIPHEPETWDSDVLYNLTTQLKKALKLLEDKKTSRRNEFGETLTSVEEGLCSLTDQYQGEEEEEDYD